MSSRQTGSTTRKLKGLYREWKKNTDQAPVYVVHSLEFERYVRNLARDRINDTGFDLALRVMTVEDVRVRHKLKGLRHILSIDPQVVRKL